MDFFNVNHYMQQKFINDQVNFIDFLYRYFINIFSIILSR